VQSPWQRHFAASLHVIVHVPLLHSRSHSEVLLHESELPPAPSMLQFAAFEQVAMTLPAAMMSQTDVLLHATVDPAPVVPLHVAPFEHATFALPPAATTHVAVVVQATLQPAPQVVLHVPVVHAHEVGV